MPIVSAFFGILIRMFYKDHTPPRFHAEYQGQHAKFDLDGRMIVGNIRSKTVLRLIREWAALHRHELENNWSNIQKDRPLERIEPLE